jgi:glycosidase
MLKELIFSTPDQTVQCVHMGIFPAQGRYFIQEMESRGSGIYQGMVDISMGKSYYQIFVNNNFSEPVPLDSSNQGVQDPLNRIPLLLKSEPFCPIQFSNAPNHIVYVGDHNWEFKAITHHKWIEKVSFISSAGEWAFKKCFGKKNKQYWNLAQQLEQPHIHFLIKISGKDKREYFLHSNGQLQTELDYNNAFAIETPAAKDIPERIPSWASGYQIFPDSFHRSNAYIPKYENKKIQPWGTPPKLYTFFGGNLEGIKEKLSYIAGLSIDFIYLNPIFASKDSHRYNCSDYRSVDDICGTNKQFQQLVEQAHNMNMKVVLDISLNHCGTELKHFKDVLKNQEASVYKDWFIINEFPIEVADQHTYESWCGYKEMPLFNLDNPEVRQYLLGHIRYWAEACDIDGWRLDVCQEIPVDFLHQLTKEMRRVKPGSLIIGETWYNMNAQNVLQEGELSGITNFSYYWDILVPFFIDQNISMSRMVDRLMGLYWSDAGDKALQSWNFMGNHDTSRFNSLLKDKDLYLLAYTLTIAIPGTPLIYYGDELGMEGFNDPANRACMNWSRVAQKENQLQQIRERLKLRRKFHDIFGKGSLSISFLSKTEKILCLTRTYSGKKLTFIFNFSKKKQILNLKKNIEAVSFLDVLDNSLIAHASISLPARSSRILLH